MDKFKILEIYNNANPIEKEKFLDSVDSKLEVKNKYRKVVCDFSWIDKMEDTMTYLDNIFRNPKRFIANEEELVKIEKSKKVTVESIKHLSQHSNYVQKYDPKTAEVRPSKILNINKEEDLDMYENRFIYTLVVNMKVFISRVAPATLNGSTLFSQKNIKYSATTNIDSEKVGIDISLNSLDNQNLSPSSKGLTVAQRIEKIKLQIDDFTNSELYKTLDKAHVTLVRSPIKRTNVILKNPNFQKAVELWNYLELYDFDNVHEENTDDSYEDTSTYRSRMNDSFLINYLLMNEMLSKGDSKEYKEEISSFYINNIIRTFVDNNNDVDEEEFVKMLRNEFAEVRRIKDIKLNRIRRIYEQDFKNFNKIIKKCMGDLELS